MIADIGLLGLDEIAHNWLPIAIGLGAVFVVIFYIVRRLGERDEEQRGREWGPR